MLNLPFVKYFLQFFSLNAQSLSALHNRKESLSPGLLISYARRVLKNSEDKLRELGIEK
jgi:hypothetical protein